MRPIIDFDNTWYSEETLVYKSRAEIVGGCVMQIVILFLFFLFLINNNYLFSIIVISPTYFLVKRIKQLIIERDLVQFTINSNGIQIKNEPIITWDNIQNERIIRIGKHRNPRYDFVFYDSKENKKIQLTTNTLSFGAHEILKSAQINRERFNRKINPI
jgi:hypothetical protein